MTTHRQILVHTAVFLAFFAATVAVLRWRHVEPPRPRMLLNQSTMVWIEVPLGLLPVPDLLNPAFGMEGGFVAWIDAGAADDLSLTFDGPFPQAWPEPAPLADDKAPRYARAGIVVNPPAPVPEPRPHGVLAVELDTGPESVRIR